MKQKLKYLMLLVLVLLLCTGLQSVHTMAAETDGASEEEDAILKLDNIYKQIYTFSSAPVTSALVTLDSGYMSVEYSCASLTSDESRILVQYYNDSFEIQSQTIIPAELSSYGGFYAGKDYYYLAFGQNNPDEDDSTEVIRIVKYDKNWNRVDAASVYGADTYKPFASGSLRMAEYGGYLYILTCHTMYTSEDGKNHQSNMTLRIQESDMSVADSFHTISNISRNGYVSHSFNQFIIIDDEQNLVTLNHGDAYPRSAVLGYYSSYKTGEDTMTSTFSAIDLLNYAGEIGDNQTNASIGGLEYSDSCYLTAGSSIIQDGENHKVQNIYITATDRNSFTSENTTFSWITSYNEEGNISSSTPHFVKLSSDSFLLLWEDLINFSYGYDVNTNLHYIFLDGKGNPTSSIYTAKGHLSDCQPIVSGSKAVWYTVENGKMTFYTIDASGNLSSRQVTPELSSIENTPDGVKLNWNPVSDAAAFCIYRLNGDSHYASVTDWTLLDTTTTTSYVDKTAKNGGTYSYTIRCLDSTGAFTNSTRWTYDLVGLSTQYFTNPELKKIESISDGITITWSGYTKPAYYIYRKSTTESWKQIAVIPSATINNFENMSFSDTDISDGILYTYTVLIYDYAENPEEYFRIYDTSGLSIYFLSQPAVSGLSKTENDILVQWNPVNGAESYNVFRIQYSGSGNSYSSSKVGNTSSTSFTDTDADCGIYRYVVQAVSGSYTSSRTVSEDSPLITYIPQPDQPVLSYITKGIDSITLSWKKVTNASGYYIYRKTGTGNWSQLSQVDSDSLRFTDSAIVSGTSYSYTVQAYRTFNSEEALSTYDTTGLSICYLAQPAVSGLSKTDNGILIQWNPVDGAETYNIFRIEFLDNGSSYSSSKAGTVSSTSFTDTNVSCGTYHYIVQAVSGSCASSQIVSEDSPKITYVPQPVLSGIANTSEGVIVTWKKIYHASGYNIYRKSGTGSWKKTGYVNNDIDSDSVSYTDSTAVSGTDYSYTVQACYTADSEETLSTYDAAGLNIYYLAQPVISALSGTANGVLVRWTPVNGAESYNIFRALYSNNRIIYSEKVGTTSSTSFTDTGAGCSTYCYAVQAVSDSSTSSKNISEDSPKITYVPQPALSDIANTAEGVTIKWKAVYGASGYNIYRKSGAGSWKKTGHADSASYTDSTVDSGTDYSYTVQACYTADSEETLSTYDAAGLNIYYLAQPVISELSNTKDGVLIRWTPVNGAESYTVYKKIYYNDNSSSTASIGTTSSSSFIDKEAFDGSTYYYAICAESGSCRSSYTTGTDGPHIKVSRPTLNVSVSSNSILLGETAVITAKGTGTITYSSSNTKVAKVNSSGTITGTGPGTATITVTAEKDDDHVAVSQTVTIKVSLQTPVLSNVSNDSKGVTVKWNAVPGAAKYRVFRKTSGSKWTALKDTTSLSCTDTKAASGTVYTYTVRCLSKDGKTFTSSYNAYGKSIRYLAVPSVTGVSNTSSGITVKWSKVTGASGYLIYRKEGSGDLKIIKSVSGASTLSYHDTSVRSKNGTTYRYTVQAYYKSSSRSSYTSGKKTVRLTKPSITAVSNTTGRKMTVKWDKNSKASGYQIKYITGSTSKTVTVKGSSSVSKVISGLTKNKTYKVYVRTFKTVSDVNYYSSWSSAKSVKITR